MPSNSKHFLLRNCKQIVGGTMFPIVQTGKGSSIRKARTPKHTELCNFHPTRILQPLSLNTVQHRLQTVWRSQMWRRLFCAIDLICSIYKIVLKFKHFFFFEWCFCNIIIKNCKNIHTFPVAISLLVIFGRSKQVYITIIHLATLSIMIKV